ncbi:hypothetical protein F1737_01705 [Methanoplanus sp. FWC-SCC4]|uniref:Xylose isomerase-like TIM barrel domain-containing protein n=1 Tax=Methanochimaera problematica TaxID=2609417 RepID=A0AA97FDJ8_9EURY|nr:hypothetical protein [Methanoplanus sp. FWC-SCC4]WOF15486.1 hypothetical protein F1737_01705 [Methanoplanus sp. FWC-SCC4]
MNYKEFLNFSIYSFDIEKFNGDWNCLSEFLRENDIDGVELLVNFDPLPDNIPENIVGGVHLPSFMGWYRVWTDNKFKVPGFIDQDSLRYFYGGKTRSEIIKNFTDCIKFAEVTNPAYGVYHAGYMEAENTFSGNHGCTDRDVLRANAEMLNETAAGFPLGEPPYDIFIENLWWPGLTFLDESLTAEFMDMLEFKKWKFMLDTGHLMNATGKCRDEKNAIQCVMSVLEKQDKEVIDKIAGLHFHQSTSAEYQKNLKEPENFQKLDINEKFSAIMGHLKFFDEHRPFTSEKCREIVEFTEPDFITHEFTNKSVEEIEKCLSLQKSSLNIK